MTDTIHRPLSADIAAKTMPRADEYSEQDYVEGGLKALGNDMETVRETLSQMGFLNNRPMKSRTRDCPIARFVKSHVGQERNVSTLMSNTLVGHGLHTDFHVFHPPAVIDFIAWFDRGVRA